MSKCLDSPAMQDTAKEAHFFLTPFRILECAVQLRGSEGPTEQQPGL